MKRNRLNNKNIFYISTIIFFVLNITNTYFLTSNTLNRYLVTFDRTLVGEINSFIGNIAILLLAYTLTIILAKKLKTQLLTLMIITLFLNIGIFSLTTFTRFYGTAMSFRTFTIFKNPSAELGLSIVWEALKDLIFYYRVVLFIPFMLMLYLYIKYDSKQPTPRIFIVESLRYKFASLFAVFLLIVLNVSVFNGALDSKWRINTARTTYVTQNIGVYSYYSYELLGSFIVDLSAHTSNSEYNEGLDLYNKNKESYINTFDNLEYSNNLSSNDAYGITYYDASLTNELNGVFKDKNLVLYHLESFNYFLIGLEEIGRHLPFVTNLLKESYVLTNFYANIGIGTSADAEFSVLTGLYPTGNTTLYWDYTYEYDEKLELNSLVKYFNELNYFTEAIHADTELFYNRGVVYPKFYNFNKFYHIDDFINDGYTNHTYNHPNPWISDMALADLSYEKAIAYSDPYFMFLMNMMPHTPFLYDPYVDEPITFKESYEKELSDITLRYLRYMKYYDEILKRLFVDPNDNSSRILDNTVYMFYGDHGSGLTLDDLRVLYDNNNLSKIEGRQKLNNTLAFIYAPSNEPSVYEGINKGLIVGNNDLVRSQVDMYRTIIELFDLPVNDDYYFGVNLLSSEPTFSIDARVLDVVTDTNVFSLINEQEVKLTSFERNLKNWIYKRKLINDLYIERSVVK